MPAITLGLAEVEERLRALRRRLNAVTVQHGAYVTAAALLLALTAIIVAGLRASAPVFRITGLVGALGVCLVAAVCAASVRRKWLDLARTARFADVHGELTDRLATLVDLRARPRPSRLAPILVAQTLALSTRWQPARVAPRRIPRSVFAPVGALLLLAATLFIERHTPPASPSTPAAPQRFARANPAAPPMSGPNTPGGPADQGGAPGGLSGQTGLLPSANAPSDQGEAGGERPSADPGVPSESAQAGQSLTDRLQKKIQQAFNGEAAEQPAQVAARADTRSGEEGRDATGPHEGGPQKDRERDQTSSTASGQMKDGTQPRQASGSKSENQDPRNPAPTDASQNFSGAAPAAGSGSNPQGLLDANASGVVTESDAKRFKLTITSFLRPMQSPPANRPPRPGDRAGDLAAAGQAPAAELALSERQIADDALRKAEIPPEYEDLVRRVYSKRAEP